jgi:hypothetical protein
MSVSYIKGMEEYLNRRAKQRLAANNVGYGPASAPSDSAADVKYAGLVKAPSTAVAYSRRHRSQWFKPEYNFRTLQIAQHTESILLRTIKKVKDRVVLAGWEFVGPEHDPVQYVKNRILQMEYVTNKPFSILVAETVEDLARQNNSMWIKVRSSDSSSGEVRKDLNGKELEPVAGYYNVQFEELEFKTKVSGELKKVRQVTSDGEFTREWAPQDVIHFYIDRKPGYLVGTPALLPALDDASLLRRIEENIEELIETNLFPAYHYKIGTDVMPERKTPTGDTESEVVKRKLEYMPAGSVVVSDHRHEITAIGAEGKALSIEGYLDYFLKRTIASAGATEIDLGMSGDANRSTANTLSKSMIMDIKALQQHLKIFIDFYVIRELLLEGGYDPFDETNKVEIKFGEIDIVERMAIENQQIQLWTNKLKSLNEARSAIGERPVEGDDEWFDNGYYKLFEEPLAMVKAAGVPGSTPAETLAAMPGSNVTPEAVNKGKQFAKQQITTKARVTGAGRKPGAKAGPRKASAAKARPANQHGTRSAPKTNKDTYLNIGDEVVSIDSAIIPTADWIALIEKRYSLVKSSGISAQTIVNSLLYRLTND